MKRAKQMESRRQERIEEKSRLLKDVEARETLKICPANYHRECLVRLRDVTLGYKDRIVCQGIHMEIRRGERIALQGKNGCGKSSILKTDIQEIKPISGEMQIGSGLKISYVNQSTEGLEGSLTAYAKAYGLEEAVFKALLRKLDVSREQFDKPMETYSEGQKKKVMIARSLCEKAHLYIWDEPLNYIDVFSRIQIAELLLHFQPTLLFVEHDKAFVEQTATEIYKMELDNMHKKSN